MGISATEAIGLQKLESASVWRNPKCNQAISKKDKLYRRRIQIATLATKEPYWSKLSKVVKQKLSRLISFTKTMMKFPQLQYQKWIAVSRDSRITRGKVSMELFSTMSSTSCWQISGVVKGCQFIGTQYSSPNWIPETEKYRWSIASYNQSRYTLLLLSYRYLSLLNNLIYPHALNHCCQIFLS